MKNAKKTTIESWSFFFVLIVMLKPVRAEASSKVLLLDNNWILRLSLSRTCSGTQDDMKRFRIVCYFTLAVSNFVIAATYSAGFGSGEPSASNA